VCATKAAAVLWPLQPGMSALSLIAGDRHFNPARSVFPRYMRGCVTAAPAAACSPCARARQTCEQTYEQTSNCCPTQQPVRQDPPRLPHTTRSNSLTPQHVLWLLSSRQQMLHTLLAPCLPAILPKPLPPLKTQAVQTQHPTTPHPLSQPHPTTLDKSLTLQLHTPQERARDRDTGSTRRAEYLSSRHTQTA
jgi:hypothetical protein